MKPVDQSAAVAEPGGSDGRIILSVRDLAVGYPSPDGWFRPVNGLSLDIRERELSAWSGIRARANRRRRWP